MTKPLTCLLSTLLLLFLSSAAQAYTISEIALADRFLSLLDARLDISDEVARAKWNSGAAIEDPEREDAVMSAFAQRAAELGLDPKLAKDFMRRQIEASKRRQRHLHEEWKKKRQGPFPHAPNLAQDIRPRLDQLSQALIETLLQLQSLEETAPELLLWRAEVLWGSGSRDPARSEALGSKNPQRRK